jgi:hypothetical protein
MIFGIFLLRTTVGLTNPANTGLCWKATLIGGTGSGDSTICCVEPTLIKRILPQIENPPSHSCAAAAVSSYDQVFIAKLVSARRIS